MTMTKAAKERRGMMEALIGRSLRSGETAKISMDYFVIDDCFE